LLQTILKSGTVAASPSSLLLLGRGSWTQEQLCLWDGQRRAQCLFARFAQSSQLIRRYSAYHQAWFRRYSHGCSSQKEPAICKARTCRPGHLSCHAQKERYRLSSLVLASHHACCHQHSRGCFQTPLSVVAINHPGLDAKNEPRPGKLPKMYLHISVGVLAAKITAPISTNRIPSPTILKMSRFRLLSVFPFV